MQYFIYKLKVFFKVCILKIFWVLPIKKNSIMVEVNWGNGYGDSPKYICEELHSKNPGCEIFWSIKKNVNKNCFPSYITPIERNSLIYFYLMARCKMIISNVRMAESFKKRRNQFYIQTWHGFGAKKVEKDVELKLAREYVDKAKNDSKNIDIMISNSKKATEIYKTAFWYDGKIIESGFPRNDILLSIEKQKKIRSKLTKVYPIIENKSVVLYAPTFRNDHNLDCYNIDIEMVVKYLNNKFNKDFIFLLRLHPNVSFLSGELLKNKLNNVLDVSDFDDMQELLSISDVLITDYSSSITDFLITEKPCFIFATDVEEYKKDRDFYFELETITGEISRSNEELCDSIWKFEEKKFENSIKNFIEENGILVTDKASSIIVDEMLRNLEIK